MATFRDVLDRRNRDRIPVIRPNSLSARVEHTTPANVPPSWRTMGWSNLLRNPRALLAYYGEEPSLTRFDLHELVYDRDGPTLHVRGNLQQFASNPSTRWDPACNVVQL